MLYGTYIEEEVRYICSEVHTKVESATATAAPRSDQAGATILVVVTSSSAYYKPNPNPFVFKFC